MIAVLIVMSIGIVFGRLAGKTQGFLKINEKLLSIAIYFLLFILGLSVGLNETVIDNLDEIGFQAAMITVGAVAGSVLVCWLLYKIFFKTEE